MVFGILVESFVGLGKSTWQEEHQEESQIKHGMQMKARIIVYLKH